MFLFSFHFFLLLAFTFFVSPTKRAWFVEALMDLICISLSCSCIRDSMKESRDVIHQWGFFNLLEWKVDTNTENSRPSLLRMESTNFSSFFSIMHFLHYMTRDLNFEKKCRIFLKLLGYNVIQSFSRIWTVIWSCFPNKNLILSHTYFGVLNPSRWNRNSLEMWMHMKQKASSSLFRYLDFLRYC